mmetsp:Transcript_73310/g.122429  ORF Transcript_73310/g.122429 Transcript_73310/m.122429 type:complete len:85 (+) Transcript_73310:110-364(+)
MASQRVLLGMGIWMCGMGCLNGFVAFQLYGERGMRTRALMREWITERKLAQQSLPQAAVTVASASTASTRPTSTAAPHPWQPGQ